MPLFGWVQGFSLGWSLARSLTDELDRFERDAEGEFFGVRVTKDHEALARLQAQRHEAERWEDTKLTRTRWLEEHRAERSFSCGVVPEQAPGEAEADARPGAGGGAAPAAAAEPPVVTAPPRPPSERLPSEPGWAAPDPPVHATPRPVPVAGEAAPEHEPEPEVTLRPMHVIAAVLPDDLVFIREFADDEVEEVGRLPRTAIGEVDVVDESGIHVPEPVRETIEPPTLVFTVLRWSNGGTPDEDRFAFRSPWMAWQAAHRLRAAKR